MGIRYNRFIGCSSTFAPKVVQMAFSGGEIGHFTPVLHLWKRSY
jgi:hypothetical protein